ncbi:AAA domain-containing protein [Paenibacillus cisolokensis]|uniref:AAA domain-containing protein n=1 Tax=Paenibacillus cisolokensis TaxID=1658519 RepID=UPI003D2BD2D5
MTLAATEDILEIFDISEKSPGIPIQWITTEDITPLIQQAEKYLAMKKEYEDYQSELDKIYDNDYFNLQAENIKSLLLSRVATVKPILNEDSFPSDNDILRFAKSIINELASICGKIEAASAAAESIFETLKIPYKRSIMGLEALHTLLSLILLNPGPTEAWFDPGKYNAIKKLSEEAKNKYDQINNLTTSISSRFDKEIFDIDYSSMLKRFKIEYTTWFKVFKRSYRTDKKQIRVLMKDNSQKFDDQTIISVLNELKEISDIHSWLNENEKILTQLLGSHYLGKMTDWGLLDQSFKQFSSILNCFSGEPIPVSVKNFLVDGEANYQDIKTRHEKLGIIKDPDLVLTLQRILPSTSDCKNLDVSVLLEMVTGVMNSLQVLDGLFTEVTKHSHKELSYDEVIDDLSKLEIIQIIDRTINKESDNLKENFQSFFNGSIQTDWGSILGALSWAGDFKKLHEKYLLPQNFIARICSDSSYVAEVSSYKKILKDSLNHIQKEWRWFANLFDNVEELQRTDLTSILLKISKCLNNISSLEEWIDFRSIRDECKKEGLSEYVQKVEELKIDKDLIVGTFLKRFYRLWVDSVISKFPAVNSFRSRSHDEIIREFNRLDITQLSLARTRIKERLVSRLPDLNMATMAMDEIGILKRELGKQRKILPLRRLFKAIPNLLLTLKPCLMMSPLSVSLFLDAENYNFDVVIFDEASQVCTEDAIGAIMRGKQVIIAGDNKQLPPVESV